MQRRFFVFLSICAVVAFLGIASFTRFASAGERIVVIGDSITGHSMNLTYGFTHEIRNAFVASGLDDVQFVPLGGSGQTIISWQEILKNSYENHQGLDIPGIDVKTELDLGADVVLVHLGMNDALQPSFVATDEGYAVWKAEYVKFIKIVKERVPSLKRMIITPPTMLTETPFGFKNLAMDRLATLAKEAADETGVEFFDVRADFKAAFENIRTVDSGVRMTLDFVHPNQLGHQAMSESFLRALGYADVAAKYRAEKTDPRLFDAEATGATFFVVPTDSPEKIVVKGRVRGASVDSFEVETPDGLTLDGIDAGENGAFEMRFSGKTTALSSELVVKNADWTRTIKINAPYFVATGFEMDGYPRPEDFSRDKATTQIDRDVLAGKNPLEALVGGTPVVWTVVRPISDETGAENPNAVDLADLGPASAFDAAYVVRFVDSPKAQTATLKMNSEGFSTTAINAVYLNGKEVYFGCLSPRHIKAADEIQVELKEGRNVLVARVDHTYWQWAISFAFVGEGLSY